MLVESYSARTLGGPPLGARVLRPLATSPTGTFARRKGLASKPHTIPYTVLIDSGKFSGSNVDIDEWNGSTSEPEPARDEGFEEAEITVALACVEYNQAMQRITGSIKVRNYTATPVNVAVRYTVNGGESYAETDAQLLFSSVGTGVGMELDMYAFSLRTGRTILTQPGQVLQFSVVVYVDGAQVCMDDNDGNMYKCRAVPCSPLLRY